jgi:hypothetical protein
MWWVYCSLLPLIGSINSDCNNAYVRHVNVKSSSVTTNSAHCQPGCRHTVAVNAAAAAVGQNEPRLLPRYLITCSMTTNRLSARYNWGARWGCPKLTVPAYRLLSSGGTAIVAATLSSSAYTFSPDLPIRYERRNTVTFTTWRLCCCS